MNFQGKVLNWAAGATRDDRYRFLKRFLDLLPEAELEQVANNASKAMKRRRRKEARAKGIPYNRNKKSKADLKAPVSAPERSVSVPEEKAAAKSVAAEEDSVAVVPGKWFEKYKPEDIVAIDVEKVEYPLPADSRQKYELKAAKVSVVDFQGNVLYNKDIQHKKGAFRVTYFSFKKNGISEGSLENGEPIMVVQEKLRELLQGKLVIVLKGEGDFSSLDLPIADYDVFDCVHFWYREHLSSRGKVIHEELGLRSLCHHYFGIDMQPDGKIHEAWNDAAWTMRLFREAFMNHPNNHYKINPDPSNEIPHYKA